jgi:DNA-binding NtrC family response regulator
VFLDEIGDTTPAFQSKLLRVLEDGEFHPVGADHPVRTEARVIAATHRHLERMVEEGAFREDLYFRLQVVEIRLPPLRDRPSDIPVLARHFLRKASQELHRSEPTLPEESLNALLQHDWPGNVRELENCLTRAVVTATGTVIRPGHLRLWNEIQEPLETFRTLEELSHAHVRRVLTATEGNKTEASRILGISKPKLYRILEAIGRGGK